MPPRSTTTTARAPRTGRTRTPARRAAGWGGARAGAGRPRARAIASEPHKPRPPLEARHPVHVTARLVAGVGSRRRRATHTALRRALRTSLGRADFRIVHLAVRGARLELLVEADDRHALARGMQGFQVAAARRLNGALARRGTVFPDRYRAAILQTRRAVRAAIAALATHAPARPASPPSTPCAWPDTWLLRVELGRVRPRPG